MTQILTNMTIHHGARPRSSTSSAVGHVAAWTGKRKGLVPGRWGQESCAHPIAAAKTSPAVLEKTRPLFQLQPLLLAAAAGDDV